MLRTRLASKSYVAMLSTRTFWQLMLSCRHLSTAHVAMLTLCKISFVHKKKRSCSVYSTVWTKDILVHVNMTTRGVVRYRYSSRSCQWCSKCQHDISTPIQCLAWNFNIDCPCNLPLDTPLIARALCSNLSGNDKSSRVFGRNCSFYHTTFLFFPIHSRDRHNNSHTRIFESIAFFVSVKILTLNSCQNVLSSFSAIPRHLVFSVGLIIQQTTLLCSYLKTKHARIQENSLIDANDLHE